MLIKVKNPELYRRLVSENLAKGMVPHEARTYAFFASQNPK